jgi:hypothetical protein
MLGMLRYGPAKVCGIHNSYWELPPRAFENSLSADHNPPLPNHNSHRKFITSRQASCLAPSLELRKPNRRSAPVSQSFKKVRVRDCLTLF